MYLVQLSTISSLSIHQRVWKSLHVEDCYRCLIVAADDPSLSFLWTTLMLYCRVMMKYMKVDDLCRFLLIWKIGMRSGTYQRMQYVTYTWLWSRYDKIRVHKLTFRICIVIVCAFSNSKLSRQKLQQLIII